MKIKLAFSCLPYLLLTKELEHPRVAQSKYCIVWVAPNPTTAVIKHEEVHVAFYYAVTLAVLLPLLFLVPWWLAAFLSYGVKPIMSDIIGKPWKSLEESFAYARDAASMGDPSDYIKRLSKSKWHTDEYGEDFHERVRKRVRWFQ